jgi:hypothetical protein
MDWIKRNWVTVLIVAVLLAIALAQYLSSVFTQRVSSSNLTNPQDALAMKQTCSSDGMKYFDDTILPDGSLAGLAQYNQSAQEAGDSTSDLAKSITVGGEQFAYNASLNTCLIYYQESYLFDDGSSIVQNDIKDIYTNQTVTDFAVYNGQPAAGDGTFDEFSATKASLMGQ